MKLTKKIIAIGAFSMASIFMFALEATKANAWDVDPTGIQHFVSCRSDNSVPLPAFCRGPLSDPTHTSNRSPCVIDSQGTYNACIEYGTDFNPASPTFLRTTAIFKTATDAVRIEGDPISENNPDGDYSMYIDPNDPSPYDTNSVMRGSFNIVEDSSLDQYRHGRPLLSKSTRVIGLVNVNMQTGTCIFGTNIFIEE